MQRMYAEGMVAEGLPARLMEGLAEQQAESQDYPGPQQERAEDVIAHRTAEIAGMDWDLDKLNEEFKQLTGKG